MHIRVYIHGAKDRGKQKPYMKQTTINDCRMIGIQKLVILWMLCTICIAGYAKTNKVDSLSAKMMDIENSVAAEQREIAILQREVEVCEKSLRCVDEHVNRTNEAVANQIAASSHTIQVWGWIIAVIAVVVTILMSIVGVHYARYINKLRKNIALLSSEAKKKFNQAKEASAEIDETQRKTIQQQSEIKQNLKDAENKIQELQQIYSDIQANANEIYESVKREETKALLIRLVNVPEDVTNMQTGLLVRILKEEDYEVLLKAYENLINQYQQIYGTSTTEELRKKSPQFAYKESAYVMLFAQHFMGRAIMMPELRHLLQDMFGDLFKDYFFINDAEKCTEDFKAGVMQLDEATQINLITDYILAIHKSRFDKFSGLYDMLLAGMPEETIKKIWKGVSSRTKKALYFAQSVNVIIEANKLDEEFQKIVNNYIKAAQK